MSPSRILQRLTRPPGLRLAVLALAATLLVAACGDDDASSTPPASDATGVGSPAATTVPATPGTADELILAVSTHAELGRHLVDAEGMSLYVFLLDTPGVSNCVDTCQENWPPLTVADGQQVRGSDGVSGTFDVIARAGGTQQVTYNGAPLYYWAADAAAGDATGHRVGDVWFVARPDTASTGVVNVQTTGERAPYLVGPDGMTLYMFTGDEPGVSNCSGACAANWPPLTVPEGLEPVLAPGVQGELAVIERADGLGRQVTYDGTPLYYWAADKVAGDTLGHEVGGVWFVVPPSGSAALAPAGTPSPATSDGLGY